MELTQQLPDDNISIKNFLRSFKRTDISRSETCKHIPLKYINFMFKDFGYVPGNSFIQSKKFNPRTFGMDLDGDIVTAKSRNPFKTKYDYELVVDVERKYFAIVRIMHCTNGFSYHDYLAKRPCEVAKTM